MEVIYALVPLLGGWLVYGLIASLFLKRASSRDYLLLISSGLVGGQLVVLLETIWIFHKISGG